MGDMRDELLELERQLAQAEKTLPFVPRENMSEQERNWGRLERRFTF